MNKPKSSAALRQIFLSAETSLFRLSPLSQKELAINFSQFRNLDTNKIDFAKFYEIIMFVTFYSGFKAETVNHKYFDIKKALGKVNTVAKFKEKDIKVLLKNSKIIRHETKIRACIHNAKAVLLLKNLHSSLQEYLYSFGSLEEKRNLSALIKDLRSRFKYLGEITVNHLLTDLGLNVIKPDRVLCRIFYRLGLVKSVTDYNGVINVGRLIANSTGLPIRYIDLIFVFYGQVGYKYELDIDNGICLQRNPKCNICGLKSVCNYYKQNVE